LKSDGQRNVATETSATVKFGPGPSSGSGTPWPLGKNGITLKLSALNSAVCSIKGSNCECIEYRRLDAEV
jgi:hypothetical protein